MIKLIYKELIQVNLLWILILTIIFSLTLNILFFSKKHISTSENIIFSILLITNFFGLLMELFTKLFTLYFSKPNQLVYIFTRIYLIYIIMFFSVFNIYVLLYCINNKEKYRKSPQGKRRLIANGNRKTSTESVLLQEASQ